MNALKNNIEIFINILEKTKDKDYPIILSGSTSLVLQGVDIEVHDIDIVTDKKGALALDNLLKDFSQIEMKYSSTDKYQSYFGSYNIDNTKVEVMGEFQYKLKNGKWSIPNHLHDIYYIDYNGIKIPVLSLSQELIEYQNSNKTNTINKIQERLCKKNKEYNNFVLF